MAETTREFKVTVEIYRDTNKQTYREREEFDAVQAASDWLAEYAAERARN